MYHSENPNRLPPFILMRKTVSTLWAAILFAWLSSSFSFANTFTWTNTSGGNWSVAANWSPAGGPPGAADTALITNNGTYGVTNSGVASVSVLTLGGAAGTQTFLQSSGNFTLGSAGTGNSQAVLNVTGGTLGGAAGSLVLAGPLNCSGGSIETLVQFNGGTFSGSFNLNGGQVINTGTLNWTAASVATGNGSLISNAPSGTINLTANLSEGNFGGARTFNNAGQLNVTVSGTATIGEPFTNSGSATINGGTLDLNGGTSSGSLAVASGATLAFGTGTFSINGGTLSGAGNLAVSGAGVAVGVGLNLGGTWTFSSGSATLTGSTTVSGNSVIISGGTVAFDGTGPWQPGTLALSAGALVGATPVTVQASNGMAWSGGAIDTNRVQFNGGSFSNSITLNGGEVINTGTLEWTATSMATGLGSIISNAPGGIIDMTANLSEGYFGGARTFDNAGQLNVSVSGTATISDTVTNTGSISVNAGTLNWNGGGTSSGSITAASGTTLEIGGGTLSINSGTLSGAGNFEVAGAVVTVGVGLNLGGTWTFSSGTTTLSSTTVSGNAVVISGGAVIFGGTGPWLPATLALSGGALEGATPVLVQNLNGLTWSGGGITTNTVQFDGGSFSSSGTLSGGEIINTGTLNWTATSIGTGNGSIISNAPTGTINLTANLSEGDFGGSRVFNNVGQINVAVSGTAVIGDAFNNNGTVAVNSGTLSLGGGGTETSAFTVASGGTLEFSVLTIAMVSGSSISGPGAWLNSAATANFSGTSVLSTSTNVINGGLVNFNNSTSLSLPNLTFNGGALQGINPVTVTGPFVWTGGGIMSNLVRFNGGLFTNTLDLNDGGEIINTGTLIWSATAFNDGNGSIISNAPTGTINLITPVSEGSLGGVRSFNNGGQLNTAISGTAIIAANFTNTGTITFNSGVLDLAGTHNLAGGTLNFGINALNNYGSNILAGAAGLAGTLKSVFNGSYLPSVGNTYNIMSYGSSSGNFTATNLSPLATWTVTQGASVLTITVAKLAPQVSVPAEVVFGNSTIGSTLKATATWNSTNVPGVFTYTPPAGTVLNIGLNQPLSVVFVPTDPSTFVSVTNNFLVNVVAAPSLAIALSGTQDILTFTATSDQSYQLQTETNLTTSNWTALGGPISNTNGTVNVTNTITVPQAFFRLQVQTGP